MCVLGEVKTRADPYHNKNGCSRETQYSDARLVEAHRLRQAAIYTAIYCHAEEDEGFLRVIITLLHVTFSKC